MGIFKALAVALSLAPVPNNDQIIASMDPWTLACAVGAENGSIGTSIGFDMWVRLSRKNWMPEVRSKWEGVSENTIENALRQFVAENRAKDYRTILRDEEQKRGLQHSPVLGPGESMTFTIPLSQ